MTDRVAAFLVVLEQDTREDDAQAWKNAIRMMRGVATVGPVLANIDQQIAQCRVDLEWKRRLADLVTGEKP